MKLSILLAVLLSTGLSVHAQINSGSDGHDGALNPTGNLVIDMADHPDGIYHYTSVNIPSGVTVTFLANSNNKPVVWLVQGNCTIAGTVSVQGGATTFTFDGAPGGPGGYRGGNGPVSNDSLSQPGAGPGGGTVTTTVGWFGANGSYGTKGAVGTFYSSEQYPSGDTYGNAFLLPLLGGSGGGGGGKSGAGEGGGGGGGGAILIAVSGALTISGTVDASGGGAPSGYLYINPLKYGGGGGSGGAIRLVATNVSGNGVLTAAGGRGVCGGYDGLQQRNAAGAGRIRIDALSDAFTGTITGQVTRGYQPIILPPASQAVALTIQTVAGLEISANPTGQPTTPDVMIPANVTNPIPVVVHCTNIPLNSEIIVDIKPVNGAVVRAVGLNTAGTQASSTATINVNMPRGGGIIEAKAVSNISLAEVGDLSGKRGSLAQNGWTADGEHFSRVEVAAIIGTQSRLSFLTTSGKRYELSNH